LKQEQNRFSENAAERSEVSAPFRPQKESLSPGGLQEFLTKWATRFVAQLKTPVAPPPLPKYPPAKAFLFSTQIVKLLNYLNKPLFWLGVTFLAWLLLELVLPRTMRSALIGLQPAVTICGAVAIGYWTNWCAVKMIFYPRVKNAVWWGLIPARRQELTELISESMVTQLVSPEIVRTYLTKDGLLRAWVIKCAAVIGSLSQETEFRGELKQFFARYLRERLEEPQTVARLSKLIQSRIAALDGDSLTEKVFVWTKSLWGPVVQTKICDSLNQADWLTGPLVEMADEWLDDLPGVLEQQLPYLEALIIKLITAGLENLNLKAMISTQLEQMDESQFEKILTGNLSPELVFIQVLGGLLGGLVGTALFYPGLRIGLLGLGIGLWVVYRVTRERTDDSIADHKSV
jgi:hypothetical protein